MSIQDESFPFVDDLEFSCESGKNFVFPHHKPRRNHVLPNNETNLEQCRLSPKMDVSSSSHLQNENDLTQSSSDLCSSSEPTDFHESGNKKSELMRYDQNKSVSYQAIHSEYTKRRYKHVESKVGQYIANIRALDEKRRSSVKFQRHRSMPETLHERETTASELNNNSKNLSLPRCSTNDLDRVHNRHNDLRCHQDTDNSDNLTTTSSLSTKDLGSENAIILDKDTYEELLGVKERNDYLQTRLDEKSAENWRLKQNLDTIRIEYSLCKDKLKQLNSVQRFSGSYGCINVGVTSGRSSLQSLLYPQEFTEKSTQTDKILTPSPTPTENNTGNEMYATPLTPDSNNNSSDHAAIGALAPIGQKIPKCIATIQPLSLDFSNLVDQDLNNSNINTTMSFLRHRSNSIAKRKKSTPLNTNTSNGNSSDSIVPSSSDSAIDIEVAESPNSQRQSRAEEFISYEQRSHRYGVATRVSAVKNDKDTDNSSSSNNMTEKDWSSGTSRNRRKQHNLRSRMMRFFGVCTKCDDPNMSLESVRNQHSQNPLLE